MDRRTKVVLGIVWAGGLWCLWALTKGRFWGILALWMVSMMATPGTALASCSYSTVNLPDGRQLTCQTCCDYQGMCQTYCQ